MDRNPHGPRPDFRRVSPDVLPRGAWLACALALVGCEGPRPAYRFLGDTALLAADEPGDLRYERTGSRTSRHLRVEVVSGDVGARLGLRRLDDTIWPTNTPVVEVDGAPAGHQAVLELLDGARPLQRVRIDYVEEGTPGLRGASYEDVLGSLDPLGAVCLLEEQESFVFVARRAVDGRLLDAPFPFGTEVHDAVFDADWAPSSGLGGVVYAPLRAPVAGVYELDVVVRDSDRSWVAEVRVVRADELVTLDVRTPTEDGISAGLVVAVPRTADGCAVLGAPVTIDVAGVRTSWTYGAGYFSVAEPGATLRVELGDLVATAVY
ncbi:MAG: hypothetical protein KC593_24185 [Myxococcales bacterium]|nr:hypothetical protein [Myxococcales bacterium]MCB9629506.1 hypothetical protein [Sandaracinaceae bacterium]